MTAEAEEKGGGQRQRMAAQGRPGDYANVRNEGCIPRPLSWGKCQEEWFEYSLTWNAEWKILSEEEFSAIFLNVLYGQYKQDIAYYVNVPYEIMIPELLLRYYKDQDKAL